MKEHCFVLFMSSPRGLELIDRWIDGNRERGLHDDFGFDKCGFVAINMGD